MSSNTKRNKILGFLTVESLVALTILGFVFMFTTVGLINYQRLVRFSKLSAKASMAAVNALEALRSQSVESLQSQNLAVTVGEDSFPITVTVCPPSTLCRAQTKTVNLKVFYNNRLMYETTTIFTTLR